MRNYYLLKLLCFLSCLVIHLRAHSAEPSWFQAKLADCKKAIIGPLKYQARTCLEASGASCKKFGDKEIIIEDSTNIYQLSRGSSLADASLGLGKCCVFDADGNILKALFTAKGNDECTKLMNDTPNAMHSGIRWLVHNYKEPIKLDWWYQGK